MRETVLLFNIKDKKRAQELQMICMSLRIRVRLIKKEEYFQTVGVLAGMKEASETDRIYEGEELADEMMVFAGVTGSHLDQILFMVGCRWHDRHQPDSVTSKIRICCRITVIDII